MAILPSSSLPNMRADDLLAREMLRAEMRKKTMLRTRSKKSGAAKKRRRASLLENQQMPEPYRGLRKEVGWSICRTEHDGKWDGHFSLNVVDHARKLALCYGLPN